VVAISYGFDKSVRHMKALHINNLLTSQNECLKHLETICLFYHINPLISKCWDGIVLSPITRQIYQTTYYRNKTLMTANTLSVSLNISDLTGNYVTKRFSL